jgi:hypothetical protein
MQGQQLGHQFGEATEQRCSRHGGGLRPALGAKAAAWIKDFGVVQTVPAAVLAGVYKRHNLENAQERGLTIFWAHDLDSLTTFVNATKRS